MFCKQQFTLLKLPPFKLKSLRKETPGNISKIINKTALTTLLFLRLQERDLETIDSLHNALYDFSGFGICPPVEKSKVGHLMTACLISFSQDRGLITALPGQADTREFHSRVSEMIWELFYTMQSLIKTHISRHSLSTRSFFDIRPFDI